MASSIAGARRLRLNCTAIQVRHAVVAWAVSIAVVMASAAMNADSDDETQCTRARVGIRFDSTADTDPGLTTGVAQEMAAVWKPHHIEIVQYTHGPNPDSDMTVAIVFTSALPPSAVSGVLGWIKFVDEGLPLPVIYLSLTATRAILATGRLRDAPMSEVPRQAQNTLFARALGRAAAHELGHYLLGSAHHSATGLMRVRFTIDQLIDDRRQAFRLQHRDRLALAARLPETAGSCTRAISGSGVGESPPAPLRWPFLQERVHPFGGVF
jgi:hypothetical protein